ncbi:MAG: ATP-binding protein [Lentimicrobium sp.]
MENPFRYGIVVDDPYFVGRQEEMRDFFGWLSTGQSLILYSPRRYGKTSLILKVLQNLKKEGYHTIYIDFFKVQSRVRFVELYYKAIIGSMTSWEKAIRQISSLVKSIRPVFSVDQYGSPSVTVQSDTASDLPDISEVFDLPQKLAEDKPWVVVFDEFQEVAGLNGEAFEKELRASLIHHNKVSYVFMGSQKHMLLNMFTLRNRAFYQFGKIVELKKIPEDIVLNYLTQHFRESGFEPPAELCREIIAISNNIPHYVQYLASAVWEAGNESNFTTTDHILNKAVDKIVTNQNDYFASLYEKLTSYQKKVLKAIHADPMNILSSDYSRRFRLSSASSTQRASERLVKDGIIEKVGDIWQFTDPFFRIWLNGM